SKSERKINSPFPALGVENCALSILSARSVFADDHSVCRLLPVFGPSLHQSRSVCARVRAASLSDPPAALPALPLGADQSLHAPLRRRTLKEHLLLSQRHWPGRRGRALPRPPLRH